MQERRVLESWKEISDYLKRSIKTCQRWEVELGLPVHRLDGTPSARVFAYPDELDGWVKEKLHPREAKTPEAVFVLRLKKKRAALAAGGFLVLAVMATLTWRIIMPPPVSFPTSPFASVAFLPFENATGDETLEPWRTALPYLCYMDFLQSRIAGVPNDLDSWAALRKLDLQEARRFAPGDLIKIAEIVRTAEYIATGSLVGSGKDIIVDLSLHDSKTGEVVQSFRTICRGERGLFGAVDVLAKEIKFALKIPRRLISRDIDDDISQIVTGSPAALKLYWQGMQMLRQDKAAEAIPLFEKAIEVDAEFSEACYQLFRANFSLFYRSGDKEAKKNAIRYGEKAFASIDRLNAWTRGSLIIEYYLDFQTNFPLAIAEFKKLLAVRTDEPVLILQLAQVHSSLEEYKKVIALLDNENAMEDTRNIQLLANAYLWTGQGDRAEHILDDYLSKNPTVSLMFLRSRELCALSQGKFDEALAFNEQKAAKTKTRWPFINLNSKAPIYVTQNDFAGAEKVLNGFLDQPNLVEVFNAYRHLAGISLTRGKVEEARRQAGMAAETAKDIYDWRFKKTSHFLMANLYRLSGNLAEARLESDEACPCYEEDDYFRNPETNAMIFSESRDISCLRYFHQRALITLEMGRTEDFEKQVEEIRLLIERAQFPKLMRAYYHLLGQREFREQNFDKAVDYFWKAVNLLPYWRALKIWGGSSGQDYDIDSAQYYYSLGEAYYQAGRFWSALNLYRKIPPDWEQRVISGDVYARSFYRMAKIYDQGGRPPGTSADQLKADKALAIESYRKFLSLWEDADPIFAPDVEDARARLAALESE